MASAIRKAAAPITGGISWPPVEETASTAPANSSRYFCFFISGMVKAPVVTTLAMALPEMVPMMALEITAILAGPPRLAPASEMERSRKISLAPLTSKKAPNRMNRKMILQEVARAEPQMP